MKSQKKTVGLLVAVLFVFTTLSLLGSQPTTDNELTYNYNRLMDIANEKGYVRVIVRMNVPDIVELTQRSTVFQTGIQDQSYIQEAFDADIKLEQAISKTRDHVLHQLNGKPYRVTGSFSTVPAIGLVVTVETLEKLKSIPEVIGIEEDSLSRFSRGKTAKNDKLEIDNPYMTRSLEIIGAQRAWGFGYTGQGWYIADIDDGILKTHEMFQGKQIVEACFSSGEDVWDTSEGDCPNGQETMYGPGAAVHYEPRFDHGSHTAGIAAGNNHVDRFGVAKNANIIAIFVGSYFPSEDDVLIWNVDCLLALEYVYSIRGQYPIAAVNMSLGGGHYTSYCASAIRASIISNLKDAGIASCVSSGNESYCDGVSDPACAPAAVAVDATTKQDTEYSYGNWHNEMVKILAPGVSITSAGGTGNTSYVSKTGTSMAAPHIAGAFAVLKQYDPTMTVDDILQILQDSGQMITSKCTNATGPKPRLNIGDAIMTLLVLAPPINIAGEQETNKALLTSEYINVLTWETNPLNQNKNVQAYRVYHVVNEDQLTLLGEVDSNTFTFWHRNAERRTDITYAFSAVDEDDQESPAAFYTLRFGVSQ